MKNCIINFKLYIDKKYLLMIFIFYKWERVSINERCGACLSFSANLKKFSHITISPQLSVNSLSNYNYCHLVDYEKKKFLLIGFYVY